MEDGVCRAVTVTVTERGFLSSDSVTPRNEGGGKIQGEGLGGEVALAEPPEAWGRAPLF